MLLARAGDTAAGNKLLRRFHRVLLRIAWQRGFDALGDDRMAIAAQGFSQGADSGTISTQATGSPPT